MELGGHRDGADEPEVGDDLHRDRGQERGVALVARAETQRHPGDSSAPGVSCSVRRRLVFGERGIELAGHLQQMRANRMETMVPGQRLLEWLKERESGLR